MTSKPSPPKGAATRPRSISAGGKRARAAKAGSATFEAVAGIDRNDPGRPPPIFVHSSFRTSSTWLWTRFRAAENAVAYCEIFHELLAELRVDQIPSISPNSWLSRHPPSSPYFIEFFDVLEPRGGARNFSAAFAFETFVPREGPRGDLSQAELDYVKTLIENPADPARVAVLTDNRTLGRCVGLKRRFGGLHLLAYRNLFHQWNSYSNQHREQNRYFLDTIKYTIEYAEHIEFFRKLKDFLHLRTEIFDGDWIEHCDYDDIFVAFVATHLYFYMAMFDAIDLVVDVNRLTEDRAYAETIEATIAARGGIRIDLSSARANIEAPLRPVSDPVGVRFKIETFFKYATREVQPSSQAEAFARRLVDEMWAEHARFTFYTRSLFAAVDSASPENKLDQGLLEEARALLAAKSADADTALERLRGLQAELDTVRDAAQRMVTEADQRHQAALAAQRDEAGRLRTEAAREKNHNDDLSARLAALEVELRHEAAFNAKLVASVDALRQAFGAVEREVGLRGIHADQGASPEIASVANDADAQVRAMIATIEDLAVVLGREREALADLEARKTRDNARIMQLLARRRVLLDQRDAVLDLVRAARTRHQVVTSLASRTAERPGDRSKQ